MKQLIFLCLFCIVFSIHTSAQELVLYFPFEGSGNDVIDESGKGNDGEFDAGDANRVASKDGRFGQAMKFGAAERIAVPESDSLKIDTEISFVMWMKIANEAGGVGTLPRIISRTGDQHELAMDSGHIQRGHFAYYFGGNPGWTGAMAVDLEWHHIALTSDGDVFKIYLDGKEESELKGGGKKNYTGITYIGSRHDLGSNEYYDGLLDELAVYAGVLDPERIEQIMTEGVLDQFAVESVGKLALTWGRIKAR